MSPYDWGLLLLGMALQFMVISTMLKGAYRRYPFVFSYLVFSFLSTVVQVSVKHYFGWNSRMFGSVYWTCDFIGTFLVLMIIIHLIRSAMQDHRHRGSVYGGLLLGVVTTGVISILLMHASHRQLKFGAVMTEVGRDYYFGALLLNVILWFMLVRAGRPDMPLFLITSGMGLKLSGAAIAHALRLAGKLDALAGNFLVFAYFLNLYVWYVAMRRFTPTTEDIEQVCPEASLKVPRL